MGYARSWGDVNKVNQAVADDIAKRIIRDYHPLFVHFLSTMEQVPISGDE